MGNKKRFQECNWYEKLWRYRFYLAIPFKWCWYLIVRYFTNYGPFNGRTMWGLLIGLAQCDMNWTYTMEEVMSRMKERYEK